MPQAKYKVYLLDDDADDLEFLTDAFIATERISGVQCFTSAATLLQLLQTLEPQALPDIIIMDHQMPLMNGNELAKAIRGDVKYRAVTIAIYSTLPQGAKMQSLLQDGVDFCRTKGNRFEEIKVHVNEFCDAIVRKQQSLI